VAKMGVINQEKANELVLKYKNIIKDHKDYIMRIGDDPEEILNWKW
jgi:phosphoketolase